MTDIEKITLKLQEIQVYIESLRREVKKQEPQKEEKVGIDVDDIVKQTVDKKLKGFIDSAIDKKVNIDFVNNLYRNK